jgi:hypothetical protein
MYTEALGLDAAMEPEAAVTDAEPTGPEPDVAGVEDESGVEDEGGVELIVDDGIASTMFAGVWVYKNKFAAYFDNCKHPVDSFMQPCQDVSYHTEKRFILVECEKEEQAGVCYDLYVQWHEQLAFSTPPPLNFEGYDEVDHEFVLLFRANGLFGFKKELRRLLSRSILDHALQTLKAATPPRKKARTTTPPGGFRALAAVGAFLREDGVDRVIDYSFFKDFVNQYLVKVMGEWDDVKATEYAELLTSCVGSNQALLVKCAMDRMFEDGTPMTSHQDSDFVPETPPSPSVAFPPGQIVAA